MATYFVDIYNGKDRPTVTNAVATNPSGTTVLITYPDKPHDLATGEQVVLSAFTAYLNGSWTITVVDKWSFTLNGATWASTADPTGTSTPAAGAPAGTSWATAWRKVYGHALALVSGDEIRVSKTPDPISIGNAAWTNKGKSITLSAARTQTIENCIGNTFSYSANVSGSAWSYRKLGANCVRIAIAAAFTTGKVAYKALASPLNLFSYQKLAFWFQADSTVNLNAAGLRICLCSDAAGDTIVNSFLIKDNAMTAGRWFACLFDNVSALGSSISSIAIYQDTNTAAISILLNNIFATNDINLRSVIGKSMTVGTDYYPIQSIEGATIALDQNNQAATGRGYWGVSETVESYCKECFSIEAVADASYLAHSGKDGTFNSPIFVKFGWNIVTELQDGETWFYGHNTSLAPTVSNSKYNNISYFCANHFGNGFSMTYYSELSYSQIINGVIGFYGGSQRLLHCFFNNNSLGGLEINGSSLNYFNIVANNNGSGLDGGGLFLSNNGSRFEKFTLCNNISYGLITANASSFRTNNNLRVGTANVFKDISAYDNEYGPLFDPGGHNTFIGPFNTNSAAMAFGYNTKLRNFPVGVITNFSNRIHSFNHDNTPGDFRYGTLDNDYALIRWQTVVKQSGALGAWKIAQNNLGQVSNNEKLLQNNVYEIAQIAVEYNIPTTVRVWVKCDLGGSTNLTIARMFFEADFSPVSEDAYVDAINSADWQELSFYFIPTYTGILVMKMRVYGYDGNVYVGSISITT